MQKEGKNKISIVTPCFNASKYIGETIESVLTQTALINGVELEYIICDGKSTDTTIDVIEQTIQRHNRLKNNIKIISEEDCGMYDALAKGLKMASGNICAYINSDDMYYRTAFEAVVAGMEINNNVGGGVRWLTGFGVTYNQFSQITNVALPYKFRNKFIKQGLYGTKLPWIQQESTFWKTDLNAVIDFETLSKFRFAGDYYLWNTFANITNLYIMQTMLGGFRVREGQLSENIEAYYKEMNKITEKSQAFLMPQIFLDKIIGFAPNRIKRLLNKEIIYFDSKINKWIMSK